MMDHCIATFKKKNGLDVSGDNKAIARIRRQCEMAKRTLSTQMSAQIEVRYIGIGFMFEDYVTVSVAKILSLFICVCLHMFTYVYVCMYISVCMYVRMHECILSWRG